MVKSFKNNRTPKTSLSWDDHYPKTYFYKRSEEIEKLKAKTQEIRRNSR